MARPALKISIAAAAALSVTLAGAATASAKPVKGRSTVALHATKSHNIAMRSTLAPGVVRLHNTGSREIFIFKRKSAGIDTLVADSNASSLKKAKDLFAKFDLIDVLESHATDYVKLGRGTYYVGDASATHARASRIHTVTVRGSRSNAVVPAAKRLTVSGSGALSGSSSGAHHTYLRFVNNTSQARVLLLVGVNKSATTAQVNAFLAHPSIEHLFDIAGDPFATPAFVGAHRSVVVHTTLPGRRYLALTQSAFGSSFALHAGQVRLLTLG